MALSLPAKLKATADITRFAQRAAQLEKLKPAIAYWCEYWIVNQLLARGLHQTDAECRKYTTALMDRLETTKAAHAHDDAIADDEAGEAYVEQFGLETFDRAERAVRANKVTKQTADTFLAAATFLELINIWHELDQETSSKIRYAKWNAVRIVKAIKDGVDPNESNPQHTEPVVEEDPLDPEDPEVKQFQDAQTEGGAQDSVADLQPTVEEVPDETDKTSKLLAAQSRLDESLHPSAEPSQTSTPLPSAPSQPPHHGYRTYSFPPASTSSAQVSPIDVSPNASIPRDARSGSVGGGYFPSVPSAIGSSADATEPASATSPATSHFDPQPQDTLPHLPETPQAPPAATAPSNPTVPAPVTAPSFLPQQPTAPPAPYAPSIASITSITSSDYQTGGGGGAPPAKFVPDDVAIAKAQKHARWAISALNFEDVDTAIRELRGALETLGAR